MASGATLYDFGALAVRKPATNYPQLGLRNGHPVQRFDGTTEETMYFEFTLPRNYGGGGITAYLTWSATSATSGDCKWGISFERIGVSQDIDVDSFASEKTGTTTCSGTSGIPVVTSVAFSDGSEIDSIAVGERVRIRVARKAADVADTINATDVEFLGLELKET